MQDFIWLDSFITSYQVLLCQQLAYFFPGIPFEDGQTAIIPVVDKNLIEDYYFIEVAEALVSINMTNVELTDKKDIIKIYEFLIGFIVNKIKQKISYFNKDELFHVLYCIASYIAEIHGRITLILNNQELDSMQINPFEAAILKFVQSQKDNNKDTIDMLKGMDKAIFQYLFALVTSTKSLESHHFYFGPKDFTELYLLTATVTKLISDREFVTNKFFGGEKLVIKKGNIITTGEGYKAFQEFNKKRFMESSKHDIGYKDVLIKLENNLSKVMGFKVSTLKKIIENRGRNFREDSLAYCIDKFSLISFFAHDGNCNEIEANSLLHYLTLQTPNDFIYSTADRFNSRIFENPIIKLESGLYLISYPLLHCAYEILYRKLKYNLIPQCKELNSKLIDKALKSKHVKQVAHILHDFTSKVVCNVQDFEIHTNNKHKKIHLHKEIDILAGIGDSLILIECKDVAARFTTFGFRHDIHKTIKFINNIQLKVIEVREKQKAIEKFMGMSIKAIIPVIVFKNYSISIDTCFDKKGTMLFSSHTFEEWLRKNFNLKNCTQKETSLT